MRISHAGKLPANEAIAKAAPTAAMKRSAPMRTRFKGSLSTTAPARIPNKAIGRKPASDAKERRREDDPVVRGEMPNKTHLENRTRQCRNELPAPYETKLELP